MRRLAVPLVAIAFALSLAGTGGSASAVDLTLPSLSQAYQDDFTIGTFGDWNSHAGAVPLPRERATQPAQARQPGRHEQHQQPLAPGVRGRRRPDQRRPDPRRAAEGGRHRAGQRADRPAVDDRARTRPRASCRRSRPTTRPTTCRRTRRRSCAGTSSRGTAASSPTGSSATASSTTRRTRTGPARDDAQAARQLHPRDDGQVRALLRHHRAPGTSSTRPSTTTAGRSATPTTRRSASGAASSGGPTSTATPTRGCSRSRRGYAKPSSRPASGRTPPACTGSSTTTTTRTRTSSTSPR